MKYAIKYRKVRYDEDIDLLVPQGLVQGELQGSDYFSTKDQLYTYVTNPILDGKVIIGDACTIDELRKKYNCDTKSYTDDDVISSIPSAICSLVVKSAFFLPLITLPFLSIYIISVS